MANNKTMIAYKGFDMDLRFEGKQYEVGKEYVHDGELKVSNLLNPSVSGFYACPEPLDIFKHYAPGYSRYCEVEISGETIEHEYKIVCKTIKILRELTLEELVKIAADRSKKEIGEHTKGDYSASSVTEDESASILAGDYSSITTTGYWSSGISTGYRSASTVTGNSSSSLATGDFSSSLVLGEYSFAIVTGEDSVAYASGYECKARASTGSWISIVERNGKGEILNMRCGKAGVDIEPDTFYKLIDGEFVKE